MEKHLEKLEAAKKKCMDKLQHAEEDEALEKAEAAHKKAMKKTRKANKSLGKGSLGKGSLEKGALEKDEDVELPSF